MSATSCRRRDGHDGHGIRRPGGSTSHSQGRIPVDRQIDGQRAGGARCAGAGADRQWRKAATTAVARLDQEPELQGGIVALDNRTGRILTMVGGFDFDRSKFNRAIQALRQLGSTFKLWSTLRRSIAATHRRARCSMRRCRSRAAPDPRRTPRSTTTAVPGADLAASCPRAVAQRADRPIDEPLGPKQVVQYAKKLGSRRRSRRTCRAPSGQAKPRCSRSRTRSPCFQPGRTQVAVPDRPRHRS